MGVVASVSRPPVAAAVRLPVPQARVPAPVGVLTRLPGDGNQLALTVDDGVSSPVVAAFATVLSGHGHAPDLLRQRRQRVVVGQRTGAAADGGLGPGPDGQPHLVTPVPQPDQPERGRTTKSSATPTFCAIRMARDGTPYFRPPFGVHNGDIDRVAADHGYTTVTLWSGDIGDSLPETEANLVAARRGHSRRNRSCWPTPTCRPSRTASTNSASSSPAATCRP